MLPKHFREPPYLLPCYREINISSKGRTLDHGSANSETSPSRSRTRHPSPNSARAESAGLIIGHQRASNRVSLAVHPSRISSMIACIRWNALPISAAGNREHQQVTLDRVMLVDVSVMIRFGTLRIGYCACDPIKSKIRWKILESLENLFSQDSKDF